jgi:hypothetical protein
MTGNDDFLQNCKNMAKSYPSDEDEIHVTTNVKMERVMLSLAQPPRGVRWRTRSLLILLPTTSVTVQERRKQAGTDTDDNNDLG